MNPPKKVLTVKENAEIIWACIEKGTFLASPGAYVDFDVTPGWLSHPAEF